MSKLRVLFNVLGVHDADEIFPKVKSMGINAISMFGDLSAPLPDHFKRAVDEFEDVNVNLIHNPTYKDRPGWRDSLRLDGEKTIAALAGIGIHNYVWMLECNLYGYKWNPLVGPYVHRDRLVEHFNAFSRLAHEINPRANVIMVPYPNPFMNLNCGIRGWKDWFVKYAEQMEFDVIAIDAHVGVWIYAFTNGGLRRCLVDAVDFIRGRGHSIYYVELGYPTCGYKPLIGGYGWGRQHDQVELLETCFQALSEKEIPYMQICEFIDPDTSVQVYEKFFGRDGRLPRFLGIPVLEEAHWGLLKKDGSEKKACQWVRRTTGMDKG